VSKTPPRVLLVVMPFLPLHRPALGVSALKGQCQARGIDCDVAYFTFDYASLIGLADYLRIDGRLPTHDLCGEWIFARAAFGDGVATAAEFDRVVLANGLPEFYDPDFSQRLLELPAGVDGFIARCADTVGTDRYDIVGFTSTFQQNCASMALARELKGRSPQITTVFGGGNADGEMGAEWLRQVSALDIVVSGEADLVFPELVERIRSGQSVSELPGVWARGQPDPPPPTPVQNLDNLALPDFSDYFRALEGFHHRRSLRPELSVETSRGCWWGQRHHCTFCGLNGTSMAYRWKSPERAFSEIKTLAETWGVRRFFAADNIVNPRYFPTLFTWIAERKLDIDIQYEMKSSLRLQQLRSLREAGATWFQPGIESLSSHVLALMDKGVTALQNVQVLKWGRELGFSITWNCLCGFPGETGEDYREMLSMMRYLTHLQPPASVAVFRLDRFSPMFDQAAARGIQGVTAGRSYRLCFPFPPDALDRLAYFFDCERPLDPDAIAAAREVSRFCNQFWWPRYGSGTLAARVADNLVLVEDSRPGWPARRELLAGVDRAVLLAADAVQSFNSIIEIVRSREPASATDPDQVRAAVERLVGRGWMLREGERYLSLPLLVGCSDDERGPRPDAERDRRPPSLLAPIS
jgi:ribosomal peptide maturation radical SAM protein 1